MRQRAVCFRADTVSKADTDIKELVKKPISNCTWNPDVCNEDRRRQVCGGGPY